MSEINKDNFKYAITYIPLVAFFFYFAESNRSEEFNKHIKYWMVLFLWYAVLSIVFRILLLWWLTPLLFVAYLWVSGVLAYKAYNWEKVEVEILDEIWDKIQEKIDDKNNKKEL